MTDQQHLITPPHDQVYWWWEEVCKRPPSSFYEKLDYVAAKAAEWGWQQRDASVPGELQEARDEELDACCECLTDWDWHEGWSDKLHAARRPKPKSLAEQSLEELETLHSDLYAHGFGFDFPATRRALERLQELEGQSND